LKILYHFGPLEEDLLEKQRQVCYLQFLGPVYMNLKCTYTYRYAVWRAAGIRKAVQEGRSTAPPGLVMASKDVEGSDRAVPWPPCADALDNMAVHVPFQEESLGEDNIYGIIAHVMCCMYV
jgi:hypothetical protein